jgi:hypothetical protein
VTVGWPAVAQRAAEAAPVEGWSAVASMVLLQHKYVVTVPQ